MTSRKNEMRKANEAKRVEKDAEVIDIHDMLHSIFWNKPNRAELKKVFARLDAELQARRRDLMKHEAAELIELGMNTLGRDKLTECQNVPLE